MFRFQLVANSWALSLATAAFALVFQPAWASAQTEESPAGPTFNDVAEVVSKCITFFNLLEDSRIERELALTVEQRSRIDALRNPFFKSLGSNEAGEDRWAFAPTVAAELDEILLAHQRRRAEQLILRRLFVERSFTAGLLSRIIRPRVELSEDQTAGLLEIEREGVEQRQRLEAELKANLGQLRQQQWTDARAVLTDEQRQHLDRLIGQPID